MVIRKDYFGGHRNNNLGCHFVNLENQLLSNYICIKRN